MIYLWLQQAHALSLVEQSNISGVAVSIGCPERGTSHVDVRSRLNSFTQLYTVANAGANVL